MPGHGHRVSSLAWSNDSVLASGSKDKSILVRDIRAPTDYVARLKGVKGHTQEVCGLRWSPHDQHILASGGNDNKLMVWSLQNSQSSNY